MIENMRGRSTETKYGRIPLWLYEAGVSLQAIATYGWLHGRYGHFERVVPSYATLARELKVSRGSVIAYVKELTAVGAVRIVTSGAAGQTTNLYEIAFNEPFHVQSVRLCGGQNADQVVSGLYSGGQNADQGGQPTVQEEDVSKKTKKTTPSTPHVPKPRAVPDPAPATTEAAEEEENFPAEQIAAAAAFLEQLPGRWAAGRRTARSLAPLLLEATTTQGWSLGAELAAKLTEDRGAVDRPAAVLKFRIEDLPAKPQAASPTPRPRSTHTPCGCCGLQAPAAITINGRGYCAACTTPCTSCNETVPTDHLQAGQCLTCLPITSRTAA